jgi:hypothetical protein
LPCLFHVKAMGLGPKFRSVCFIVIDQQSWITEKLSDIPTYSKCASIADTCYVFEHLTSLKVL